MTETQQDFAKRFYNQRSPTYEDSWHPSFAARFTALAELQPGQNVLDVACGTGLVTFDAAARVGPTGKVIGLDVSDGMLNVAKAKKQQLGETAANISLYLHNVTDLDRLEEIQGQLFDVITCASALVLLGDAQAALNHWIRFLKPGGLLLVDVPHEHNLIASSLLEPVGRELGLPIPWSRSWVKDQSSLREALETAGFVVEKELFVEQAGYHKRQYSSDDAEDQFVSQLMSESGRQFRMPAERREKALELFKKQWENASVDGKLEDIDGVYVAKARKPA